MKKTKHKMLRIICFLSFIMFSLALNAQKIHVNKEWRDDYGDPVFNPLLAPYGGDWTKSIVAANSEIITVAHTYVSGQGENVLLTRFDDSGTPIWQVDYNSSSTNNDYGINLFEASNGDIYVCGTTDNGGSTNYDVLILIYDSSGNLLYDNRYDGPDSKNDIPAAINIDSQASQILIAGTSESSSTGYDYLVLGYDLTLNLNWSNTYDFANLSDVAVQFVTIAGKFTVAGASANSLTDWDMTTVDFDESNGSYQGDNRMNYPGFGYDEIYAFRKDANDHLYAVGKCSSNGINYNIRTVKIDSTNTLIWSQTYDANGLEDIGSSIAVDALGNVVVGGFITKTNNKRDLIVLKYDGTGTLLWKHTQSSSDPTDHATVKAISINPSNGNIYIIAGDKEMGSGKRAIVARLNPNGRVAWEKYIKGNYEYLPSDIQYGGLGTPGIFAIAIKDSTVNAYELNYFTEHELDTATIYTGSGSPICPKKQLITMFDTSAIIKSMIDNKNIVCGQIENFVKSSVVSDLKDNLASIYGTNDFEIKAFKIFPELTTKDTTTISRLGETIRIPEFYSMLLLELPAGLNIVSSANSMESLFPDIVFSHPNFICTVTANSDNKSVFDANNDFAKIMASANDSIYPNSANLHPTTTYANAHVNAEEAWDLETGKRHVRVGVFDTGCFHGHREFMDSTKTITKITGWDFFATAPLINDPIGEGLTHGTNVSGIIAANRNSHIGIAGIAGGNFKKNSSYLDSSGINLHGMRILTGGGQFNAINYLSYIADGMVTSTIYDPSVQTFSPKYGLHIMNHSWRISNANVYTTLFLNDSNITILREASHFVNRAHVTNVCAIGNENNGNPTYPAGIDDDWILSVGGSGPDGKWDAGMASYKNNIDLIAPSNYNTLWTTGWAGGEWQAQGGTSMAAPHVSGAAALLMSYYNKPTAHPDNLAPEDVEYILQKTATDVNAIGPDDTTGHGRLNIGKAIKYIKKPRHRIRHIGTNTCYHATTLILSDTNEVIKLTERYKNAAGQWFKPNIKYILRTYRVLAFVYDTLSPKDSLKGMWLRHSSCNVLEQWNNGKLRPRERMHTLNHIPNLNQWSMEGNIYHVRDSLGNFLGWWPFDTSAVQTKMQLTLSLLIKDTAFDVGIRNPKVINHSVKVYPNPTSGSQILEINSDKNSRCRVDIFDMLGRSVFSQENIKVDEGSNKIPIPTNGFPIGMYIYNVKLDEEHYYYKILKQ